VGAIKRVRIFQVKSPLDENSEELSVEIVHVRNHNVKLAHINYNSSSGFSPQYRDYRAKAGHTSQNEDWNEP
jgi:hypothetical protein